MRHRNELSTVLFTIALAFALSACSVRRIYSGEGGTDNQSGVSTCTSEPSGTLIPINRTWTDIKIGDTVFWMATVSGCTGRYVLTHAGGTVNFTSSGPGVYSKIFSQSGSQMESVSVQSVDASGNVLRTFTLQSQSFEIAAALSCSVTANASSVSAPVNAQGQMLDAVNFSFQVLASSPVSLKRVLEQSVAIPANRLNVSLPDASSLSHAIQVSVPTIGQHTYAFEVGDSSGNIGQCTKTITVTPVVTPSPSILSFTATPAEITLGQPVELGALVTGNITSAKIDGVDATVSGGVVKRTVTPNTAGTQTSTIVLTGPGGSSSRTVTYSVAAGCAIRLPAAIPAPLPGNMVAKLDITGEFSAGYILGNGIDSVILVGGAPFLDRSVTLRLFRAPTDIIVYVYGTNGSVRTCEAQISSGPLPTVTFQGSGSDQTLQALFNANQTVAWSASGASSCTLRQGSTVVSSGIAGSYTTAPLKADTSLSLVCVNNFGTTTRVITLDVVGKWFQANDQHCPTYCQNMGASNILSPDNARCASGEVRPNSAKGYITYPFGTWGTDGWTNYAASNGGYCYASGQVVDGNGSDRTTGCFCGP